MAENKILGLITPNPEGHSTIGVSQEVSKKIKKEKEKDEITYRFYNTNGLVLFATNDKRKAKEFLKKCIFYKVEGHIAKFPVLGSFWTIAIIEYTVILREGD
jgi:hypothetical protein